MLSTTHRSLQREFASRKRFRYNILHDKEFDRSRQVLASKRKQLKKMGYGSKPNATREITEQEMLTLFREGYFGDTTPASVQRTVWWYISINFGFRGRDEARQLCWGDVSVGKESELGVEYLEWNVERTRKRAQGMEKEHDRISAGRMYQTKNKRCPMHFFKMFAHHRPQAAQSADSPFFLTEKPQAKLSDAVWYLAKPMGVNTLGNIMTNARKLYGFQGRKVANHSVRKTGIGRLLDANVPEIYVAQHSGMASTESLKSYKCANPRQQSAMSAIVNSAAPRNELIPMSLAEEDDLDAAMSAIPESALRASNSSNGVFYGATFNNCTINLTLNMK